MYVSLHPKNSTHEVGKSITRMNGRVLASVCLAFYQKESNQNNSVHVVVAHCFSPAGTCKVTSDRDARLQGLDFAAAALT